MAVILKRRESREAAFLLTFEWSFREDETLDEIIELARDCRDAEYDDFAKMLVTKTINHCIQIDKLIEKYSDNWKLNRLSKVTLAVLRMSFCEMLLMDDIPVGATINEAVEIMKKFATEDEASFVNGILGAYHRAELPENDSETEESAETVEENIEAPQDAE